MSASGKVLIHSSISGSKVFEWMTEFETLNDLEFPRDTLYWW